MSSTTSTLDVSYPLLDEQVQSFQQCGHIKLAGLATPEEIAVYRPAIVGIVEKLNNQTRPLEERDTYGKAFIQITNLWKQDETVKRFVLARKFAKVAAELMGVNAVRLYHDQALFKEPSGGGTPWHQDQYYWPLDTDKTVTLWMPLVDADTEMGTMRFASGSQKEGYLGELPISDESELKLAEFLEKKGYTIVPSGEMKAGDATFHTGWTLHGAPGNNSPVMREVMTIIYFADGVRIAQPDNPARLSDLKSWHPGQKPGDLAGSELNPLLYSSLNLKQE